jgi:predicted nucleic acid-binding protein
MDSITKIVIDTSVILDIMLETRPRHPDAKELCKYIVNAGLKVRMPMHGMFEIMCATVNVKMDAISKGQEVKGTDAVTEEKPLSFDLVPIDTKFLSDYHDPSIPYIKASGLIFISLAKHDSAVLITEDAKMYSVAKAANVNVYRIKEFMDSCL